MLAGIVLKLFIGLVLLVCLVASRSVRWGLVTLVFIAALFPDAGRSISPSIWAHFDLMFLALFAYALFRALQKRQFRVTPLDGLLLVWIVFGLIAMFRGVVFFSAPLKTSFFDFYQRIAHVCVFWMVVNVVSRKWLKSMLAALIGAACISAAFGVLQVAFGFSVQTPVARFFSYLGNPVVSEARILKYIWWTEINLRKAFAFYPDPNSLAGLLILGLAVIMALLYLDTQLRTRRYLLVAAPVLYACLQLTFSRAAVAGFMAAMAALLLYAFRDRRKRWVLFFSSLIVMTPALQLFLWKVESRWFFTSERIAESIPAQSQQHVATHPPTVESQKTITTEMKRRELEDVLFVFANHPLGIGFSTSVRNSRLVPTPHAATVSNFYLEVLVQLGLPGLLILCLILIRLSKLRHSFVGLRGRDRVLAACLLSGVLSILVNGLFDHTFYTTPALNLLFWILLGMAYVLCYEPRPPAPL